MCIHKHKYIPGHCMTCCTVKKVKFNFLHQNTLLPSAHVFWFSFFVLNKWPSMKGTTVSCFAAVSLVRYFWCKISEYTDTVALQSNYFVIFRLTGSETNITRVSVSSAKHFTSFSLLSWFYVAQLWFCFGPKESWKESEYWTYNNLPNSP